MSLKKKIINSQFSSNSQISSNIQILPSNILFNISLYLDDELWGLNHFFNNVNRKKIKYIKSLVRDYFKICGIKKIIEVIEVVDSYISNINYVLILIINLIWISVYI